MKSHRLKTWAFLKDLDAALQSSMGPGGGLAHFRVDVDPAKQAPPSQWPVLTIAADEGSDIWAGTTFLERKARLNVQRTPDTNHGTWNDFLQSCFDAGLGPFLYLMTVLVNYAFMPFGDGRVGREMMEAMAEYGDIMDKQCILFIAFFEHLQEELGLGHTKGCDNEDDQVWRAMLNCS